jgi:hypothetical protein
MHPPRLPIAAFGLTDHCDQGRAPSLNPLYLQGTEATDICALGYSLLTNYDSRGAIVADAAAIVPTIGNGGISRDGKRIVYHLRHALGGRTAIP